MGSFLPASMPQQAHILALKVVDWRSMSQCGGPSRRKLNSPERRLRGIGLQSRGSAAHIKASCMVAEPISI